MTRSDPMLVDRTKRLFTFLAKTQAMKSQPIRTVAHYERRGTVHWLGEFAEHPAVHVAFREEPTDDNFVLSVGRVPKVSPPALPQPLSRWVSGDLDRATAAPRLKPQVSNGTRWDEEQERTVEVFDRLENSPDVQRAFAGWFPDWQRWADQEIMDLPVRDLYSKLFETHVKAEGHSEEFELILAVGLLTWHPEAHDSVNRHVFNAAVTTTIDDRTGQLVVHLHDAAIGLQTELDMLDPGTIPQRQIVHDVEEAAHRHGAHPLDQDALAPLVGHFINNLDAEGAYHPGHERPSPTGDAVLSRAPALILRPRSMRGLVHAFETIAEQIEAAGEVPDGLLPLVDPDHQPATTADPSPGGLIAVDDEIFSPLPLNQVQRQIIERVDHNAQTLVQGPPGTGKTHTAAALLSHMLAQGKRVLVTAHTDRALQEVRTKLPEQIKPLAVSVIGSSRSDMADLKLAVDTISRHSSDHDPEQGTALVDAAMEVVESLRRQRAELNGRLLDAREGEVKHHEHLGYAGTLAAIAQQVTADSDDYAWITPFIDRDSPNQAPITNTDALRWLDLLTDEQLGADADEAQRHLISLEQVPPPAEFSLVTTTIRERGNDAARFESVQPDPVTVLWRRLGATERQEAMSTFRRVLERVDTLRRLSASWSAVALRDMLAGTPQVWVDRKRTLDGLAGQVQSSMQQMSAHATVSVEGEVGPLVSLAKHLLPHVQQNPLKVQADGSPKIGLFTPGLVKQCQPLFTQVRVNGMPPTSPEAVQTFLGHCEAMRLLDQMDRTWPADVSIPEEDTPGERLSWHGSQVEQLSRLFELGEILVETDRWLQERGIVRPDWTSTENIQRYCVMIEAADASDALQDAQSPIDDLAGRIVGAQGEDAAPAVAHLLDAVRAHDLEAYRTAYSRLARLHTAKRMADELQTLTARLKAQAPALLAEIELSPGNALWHERLTRLEEAWAWSKVSTWVVDQDATDVNAIQLQISLIETKIRERVEHLAATRAWNHAVGPDRLTGGSRADLNQYSYLVRRLGKGTGKYAAQQRAEIRVAMDRCRPSVPVWVMPIYRIAEQLEINENLFDVVIIDEASQAGLEATFLQYLAPKIVVIGDDKQVSPSAVGVDQGQLRDLADQYLHDDPYKSSWQDPVRSFFDEASMRFGGRLTLVEHRRCVPEIIGFSNQIAYEPDGIRLVPVRQYGADRLPPIQVQHIADGYETGTSSRKVNIPEAEAVVAQVLACLEDPAYDDKTFGIISLVGKSQAQHIEHLLMQQVDPAEWADRELRAGDAADFQGSERDVMFLSMVTGTPGEGQRMASLTRDTYLQRFNVAVSRAKDQMWLFHSVPMSAFSNAEDLRRRLLEYVYAKARQGSREGDEASHLVPDDRQVEPFDSLFEQRVHNMIADRGYLVQPQVEAIGYRIDLVIIGSKGRLAVECDGDAWHGPEAYARDLARQRDLERCGWTFFRVRESSFYVDRAAAMSGLWSLLEELEIRPPGVDAALGVGLDEPEVKVVGIDSLLEDEVIANEREEEHAQPFDLVQLVPLQPPRESRLTPYERYDGGAGPVTEGSSSELIDGLRDVVAVEGPVLGQRLSRAYVLASGGQRLGRTIQKELNRALSEAVRRGVLVSDNPLRVAGLKHRTFRLPDQPLVRARDLGPRSLDEVPPAELARILVIARDGAEDLPETEVFRRALALLGKKSLTKQAREQLESVKPLLAATATASSDPEQSA